MNRKRIIKSIIRIDELEWDWNYLEEKKICFECGGNVFYIKKLLGIVKETSEYQIAGYKDKTYYSLREYGFKVYCAECGEYEDIYFIDNVNLVYDLTDIKYIEKEEIEYLLTQYNQKRTYEPRIKNSDCILILEKIKEYGRNERY